MPDAIDDTLLETDFMKFAVLIWAFALVALPAEAQVIDIPFWDASGKEYTTVSFGTEVQKYLPNARPTQMLVVGESDVADDFKLQMQAIVALGHGVEDLELIIVQGAISGTPHDGYWITSKAAASLLSKAQFKVIFLDSQGRLCSEMLKPVTPEAIRLITGSCSRRQ